MSFRCSRCGFDSMAEYGGPKCDYCWVKSQLDESQARCCALEEALESSKEYLDLSNEENFNPNEADNLFDKIKEALEIHGPAALKWLEKQKMEARREGAKQND